MSLGNTEGLGGDRTATNRAYTLIREGILSGRFAAGQALPEEDLAELAGVSRTPVREALRRLGAEGLVELLAHRGARVARWSDQDLDEIFELRVELEGRGARLAALHGTDELLVSLGRMATEMETEVAGRRRNRIERISEINNRFHHEVLAAGGNRRLISLVSDVLNRGLIVRTFAMYRPDQLERSCRHHREIIDAIAMRDPDWAEATMRGHIYAGWRVTQGVIPRGEASQPC